MYVYIYMYIYIYIYLYICIYTKQIYTFLKEKTPEVLVMHSVLYLGSWECKQQESLGEARIKWDEIYLQKEKLKIFISVYV